MPTRPRSPCSHPLCPNLAISDGRCEEHAREYNRQREARLNRGSAASLGYGAQWRKTRAAFLKGHPWCEQCLTERRYVTATEVDHQTPRKQGGTDAPGNLQALCKAHHSSKTARQSSGWGGASQSLQP